MMVSCTFLFLDTIIILSVPLLIPLVQVLITVLSIHDECTANGGVELACNDDYSSSQTESHLSYDIVVNTTHLY